jgi:hypothetical protein
METGPGRRYLVTGCAGFIELSSAEFGWGPATPLEADLIAQAESAAVAEAGRPLAWAEPA